ncbi:MAG: hypothetical protein WCJ49_07780, partial [Deltaproteobacteria bacterium]
GLDTCRVNAAMAFRQISFISTTRCATYTPKASRTSGCILQDCEKENRVCYTCNLSNLCLRLVTKIPSHPDYGNPVVRMDGAELGKHEPIYNRFLLKLTVDTLIGLSEIGLSGTRDIVR